VRSTARTSFVHPRIFTNYTNMNNVHLSIIIPAYNESERLPSSLREINNYLKNVDYNYEIIVVNDGSQDDTAQIVRNMMSTVNNLRLIDDKENHGKGYSIREAMLSARGDYRIFDDADNSTSIDQIEKVWTEFDKGYDVVIGSRIIKGAVIPVRQSLLRRFVARIFYLLAHIICGLWGIHDTQCGFKAFRAKAAQDIFARAKINRFAFDVEVLVIAKRLGYKIKEIPVRWIEKRGGKVKFKSMFNMFKDLIRIRLNLIKGYYNK